ncbi:MAG TPA: gamma-glutamyl-gamma-aminobutyrate hydrolase family protein [Candidatus Saccharimonadales bacterium]|nr:gamma-glutamyl-gamma-aminobutyrate hydrolase family protein [Candidatus Saccharimonadales bacterium]
MTEAKATPPVAPAAAEDYERSHQLPSVAIVDTGAQMGDVIHWQLVEAGIRPEIIRFTRGTEPLDVAAIKQKFRAVIFSGSGESVNDEGSPQIPLDLLDGSIPVWGTCFGAQAIAKALGGDVGKVQVEGQDKGEYGATAISVDPKAVIYAGIQKARVLMSHGDTIKSLPNGFKVTGWSGDIIASFESSDGRIVATQYHPEVAETDDGVGMMLRFLKETTGITPDPEYNLAVALDEYMAVEAAEIAEKLSTGSEIRGFLSGGVDSMVAAREVMRVAQQEGRLNQVRFYYVDNGHTRIEDDSIIDQMLAEGMPVEKIEAAHEFFHSQVMITPKDGEPYLAPPLTEVADPELKRLIIGTIFKEISESIIAIAEVQAVSEAPVYFVQGTNASDIVESGGHGGKKIKGHHNIEAMESLRRAGRLIEPLRGLMKYHVRYLAERRYGLPEEFASRQPFPGVGFSPRIIVNLSGELERPEAELQARLDEVIKDQVGDRVRGHIVKIKSVGQKGDDRSIADAVFLEGDPDWGALDRLSVAITNQFGSVNRVFYAFDTIIDREDIGGAVVRDDEEHAGRLREMEEVHRQAMLRTGLDRHLSQHFVGTLPVDLYGLGSPTLALRLFITGDNLKEMVKRRSGENKETFRTGIAAVPGIHVDQAGFNKLVASLKHMLVGAGYSSLVYDLTGKPPGTTEWE